MVVTLSQTDDADLILSALRHPRIYRHIADDDCPKDASLLRLSFCERVFYLAAHSANLFLGVFVIERKSSVMYEVHTALTPAAWGAAAKAAACECVRWVFENTGCQRLITAVPAGNVLASRLAERAGMAKWGVNEKAFSRNGALLDLIMYGISKGGG